VFNWPTYRLEEPILHALWGVTEGFFGYNSPNLNGSGLKLEYMWGHSAHSHKKIGEIVPVVLPKGAKTCFFLS